MLGTITPPTHTLIMFSTLEYSLSINISQIHTIPSTLFLLSHPCLCWTFSRKKPLLIINLILNHFTRSCSNPVKSSNLHLLLSPLISFNAHFLYLFWHLTIYYLLHFFFLFQLHLQHMKFLGQGSNPSRSGNCSLTCCATAGTP